MAYNFKLKMETKEFENTISIAKEMRKIDQLMKNLFHYSFMLPEFEQ